MQFCVTRVILRDLAALVPQIFHSLHKITHFLTGYINSYYFRQFHYTTQWNNNLLIPLSGVMKLTYPTEWSNEMRPVMKFLIPLK
jgi:hypothetical protein